MSGHCHTNIYIYRIYKTYICYFQKCTRFAIQPTLLDTSEIDQQWQISTRSVFYCDVLNSTAALNGPHKIHTCGLLWQVFKRTTCSCCWKNIKTYKIQIKFKNCLKFLLNWPIDTVVTVGVREFWFPSAAGITKHRYTQKKNTNVSRFPLLFLTNVSLFYTTCTQTYMTKNTVQHSTKVVECGTVQSLLFF